MLGPLHEDSEATPQVTTILWGPQMVGVEYLVPSAQHLYDS